MKLKGVDIRGNSMCKEWDDIFKTVFVLSVP